MMTVPHSLTSYLAGAAGVLVLSGPALAQGMGGMGGMSGSGGAMTGQSGMNSGSNTLPSWTAPNVDPAAEYRKGIEAFKAHRYREAEEDFDRVLTVAPENGDVWLMKGLSEEGAGNLKGAEKAYEKSVRYDPNNVLAHEELGLALARLNQTDKAKAELELLQKKAAACGDRCADAETLKTAVSALQGAMGAG
jgi:predicted Zn-dependent protease